MKGKRRCIKTIVVALMMMWGICLWKMPVEAATSAQKESFRAELEEMLYTADSTVHDVYDYRLTTSEFNSIYQDMKNGDCRLIIASYYSNMRVTYTTKWFWIDTIQITNIDSDVLPRYERLKANVEDILAGIEEDMTDLDKVIYLHDALVDLTSYKYVAYQSYGTCGALGDRLAVCAGYTQAYNMLLDMQGIETDYIHGDGINHAWTYVKIDGEWYHIDATWDDTRSSVKGTASHQFMLKNDTEFVEGGNNSHVGWYPDVVSVKSTSTRFSDWYVHDITGKMSFENGYWYYVDTANNDILCADALGQECVLVLDGGNLATLTLIDVEDGKITYKVGNNTVTENLSEVGNDVVVEVPEVEVLPEYDNSVSADNDVAISDEVNVGNYDFNDIANWKEGQYDATSGSYIATAGYICTKELVVCDALTSLGVAMKDTRFHGVVNEYTEDGRLLVSTDVVNGDEIVTNSECAYIGVSIYFPNWKTISFAEYTKKFTYDLMTFELTVFGENKAEKEENTKEEASAGWIETIGSIAEVDFNDIGVWQMGGYDTDNGALAQLEGYICTQKYVEVADKGLFEITMKDARFHTVINEYRNDGSFVCSTDLVNGDSWIPNTETAYIGVSIYFPMWKSITFEEYTKKFTYNLMSLEITRVE